jgi:hypothetical protein
VFVDPVKEEAIGGEVLIDKHAPNPWEARFLASAYLEESVQRRLLTDVNDQVPVRTDVIDFDSVDVSDYTRRRLTTNTDLVGFYELNEYSEVFNDVKSAGVMDDL